MRRSSPYTKGKSFAAASFWPRICNKSSVKFDVSLIAVCSHSSKIYLPSSGTKDGGSVINDGVDTGDMDENRQAESDEHRASNTGAQQIAPACLFRLKAGLDFPHFKLCAVCS